MSQDTTKPVCKPRQLARDLLESPACRGGRESTNRPAADRRSGLLRFRSTSRSRTTCAAASTPGEWSTGERIPPELTLAREYDVSRVTVRQALAELVKDDLARAAARQRQRTSRHQRRPLVYDLNLTLGALATRWRDADFDNRAEVIEAGRRRRAVRRAPGTGCSCGAATSVLYLLRRVFINDPRDGALPVVDQAARSCPGLESSTRLQRVALRTCSPRSTACPPRAARASSRSCARHARRPTLLRVAGDVPLVVVTATTDLARRTAARALAAGLARRPGALPRHRVRVGSGLPECSRPRLTQSGRRASGLGQRDAWTSSLEIGGARRRRHARGLVAGALRSVRLGGRSHAGARPRGRDRRGRESHRTLGDRYGHARRWSGLTSTPSPSRRALRRRARRRRRRSRGARCSRRRGSNPPAALGRRLHGRGGHALQRRPVRQPGLHGRGRERRRRRADADGDTLRDAMAAAGFDLDRVGDADRDRDIGAYLELHIEQGPVLEAEASRSASSPRSSACAATACGWAARRTMPERRRWAAARRVRRRRPRRAGAARRGARREAVTANVGKIAVEPEARTSSPGSPTSRSTCARRRRRDRRAGAPRRGDGGAHRGRGGPRRRAQQTFALEPLELDRGSSRRSSAPPRRGRELEAAAERRRPRRDGRRPPRARGDDLRPQPRRHQPLARGVQLARRTSSWGCGSSPRPFGDPGTDR